MESLLIQKLFATAPEQLELILETMDAGIVVREASGRLIYANQAAARMVGYPSREALIAAGPHDAARQFEIMDELGRPVSLADLPGPRALRGEATVETRLHFRPRDGGEDRWSLVTTTPILDDEGNVTQVISIFRDITVFQEAEEGRRRLAFLAEASQVLASSLDYESTLASVARLAVPHIADWCAVHIVEGDTVRQLAVAHVDPDKVRYARELEERYPYDPDAPAGVPRALRTRRSELISVISDELLEQAVGDDPELLRVIRELDLRSSMVVPLMARDRVLGAITFVAAESDRRFGQDDLTLAEELASRAALAVDNARLYRESMKTVAEQSAILDHLNDGVVLVSQDAIVTYLNRAAIDMTGFDAVGQPISTFFDAIHKMGPSGEPLTEQESALVRALHGETAVNVERRIIHPDKGERIILVSTSPVVADNGRQIGAVMVFRDVTAERELEMQKDAFLAAAAHDLKNPLAAIKGVAQLLSRQAARGQSDKIEPGLAQIDAVATRMTRLINELIDVSRLEMGSEIDLNFAQGNLPALIRQVVDEHQRSTDRHRLRVEADDPRVTGYWDMDRLERVFANLISNAIKYSPQGGDVVITITRDDGPSGPEAVVTVKDTGLGIPADDLPRIFERFFRGRNTERIISGTGIGLSGVKHIVERHGGSITAESCEGHGSRFTVRLPLAPQTAQPSREVAPHG